MICLSDKKPGGYSGLSCCSFRFTLSLGGLGAGTAFIGAAFATTAAFAASSFATSSATFAKATFAANFRVVFGSGFKTVGQGRFEYGGFNQFFDVTKLIHLLVADEGQRHAGALGTGSTPHPVHIVFRVVGHIVVDHQIDAVHIDAPGNDVGGYQNLRVSVAEAEHHLFPLPLFQIGVNGLHRETGLFERTINLLYLYFGGRENHHAGQVLPLEQLLQQSHLLVVVHHISRLQYALGGFGHGNTYFFGLLQQFAREFADLGGHGGRKKEGLPILGQILHNLHNVVVKTHVEHAIGFIQNQVFQTGELKIVHRQMLQQSPRCGYHHVGSADERLLLLVPQARIVAAINGDGGQGQKVGKALQLLVNLY